MEKTLNKIRSLYSSNLQLHGEQSKAVGWTSKEFQILRFEKLTSCLINETENFTVNDYGCGYAAHLDYLFDEGLNVTSYFGYDISTDMLDQATRKKDLSTCKVQLINSSEINTVADYTFVSGTFNVRFESSEEEWKEFIKKTLHMIFNHSLRGFSFNLLTKHVDWEENHLYYGDPCYWFEFCRREFSSKIILLHDYPLYEWTIAVKK